MVEPYYSDKHVTLYHGDWRERTFPLGTVDAIITDPPYGETPLEWDRWPQDWPSAAAEISTAMWCFGSMRMFLNQRDQFTDWKFSHEIVWEKQTGTGLATDKFTRVHEFAVLWYRGEWREVRHETPKIPSAWPNRSRRKRPDGGRGEHIGFVKASTWVDDGTRYHPSVIKVDNEIRKAIHPTQKPLGIVAPLIQYSVPYGGTVVDLFSGSGTVALAARNAGRKCIAFEAREDYCEKAANRLAQQGFDFGDWESA